MKRIVRFADGELDVSLTEETVKKYLTDDCSIIWLDIETPVDEDYQFLVQGLGLHALAVEDCREEGAKPKMEDYGHFFFFAFRGINYYSGSHALDTLGIKIFFTRKILITVHHKNSKTIEEVLHSVNANPQIMVTTEKLLFKIMDILTDNIMPVINHINERLDTLQHHIFKKFSPSILEETFELKKWVLRLKRFLYPQQQIITKLIQIDHSLFSGNLTYQLRDILDHTQEVLDHLAIYEELFPDAMNSYLSQVTNRMNEVMKTMSIIATLMLPLSFVTGIFGMNFHNMPLINEGLGGFWKIVSVMVIIFLGMVVFFRKKDWF